MNAETIAFVVGFIIFLIFKDRTLMHAALLPLLFFGGLGLYLFPWSGYNLIAQFSHIIMTLNALMTIWVTLSTGDYKAATFGLLLGILIFVPFINFQQTYAYAHRDVMQRVLGVNTEDFQKKMGVGK